MTIEKKATKKANCLSPFSYFGSAREAFARVLALYADLGMELLLPSYIGYSSKEGSGIYDPVVDNKIKHTFYRLNRNLQIDMNDLHRLLEDENKKIVLLVHYFGIPDSNYDTIIDMCREHNAYIVEDAAHALYSSLVNNRCGHRGDYVFYSLHKMLPLESGGMLRCNTGEIVDSVRPQMNIFDYDLRLIAEKRNNNAALWDNMIRRSEYCPALLEPLYCFRTDATYQTYPIVVKNDRRDSLYFGLNERGFGAVSLYHEMIEPLKNGNYSETNWLSNHILNLPVHQDVGESEIADMFDCIISIMGDA